MERNEQLAIWKQGRSLHNDETDQCCPDFSCCKPELLAEQDVRTAYIDAVVKNDEVLVHRMNVNFIQSLANLIAFEDPEIGEILVLDTTPYAASIQ